MSRAQQTFYRSLPARHFPASKVLTIRGEHVERQIKEGGGFTRTERTRRSFTRSFTVPTGELSLQQGTTLVGGWVGR